MNQWTYQARKRGAPAASPLPRRSFALRHARGFTLMELMVVVVILAILTVVAVFSYKKIQRSARSSDGIALLGEIKAKQDVFYNTYSAYESSTTDETTFDGQKLHGVHFGFYRWDSDCAADAQTPWCRLGFNPTLMQADGESRLLYFQLQTIGYSAKTKDNPPSFINNPEDRWLVVQGRGLPNDDGTICTLLRITNESREAMTFGEHNICE
jgi:prepilin-type N-terminal cleavage/methylation domain-containing protein